MSFSDPLCKSPLECDRAHVAFAEIRIDWCGLQSGLVEQMNKANRLQVEIPQVQRNCLERHQNGGWVLGSYGRRGRQRRHGDTGPPAPPLPLLSESRKEEEITGHRRWDHQLQGSTWGQEKLPQCPLFPQNTPALTTPPRKTVAPMQSRFLSAVCVSVVALQGKENIHNPHIVGSPDITNKRWATAPTPAEPQNGHSWLRGPNGLVCPYKFRGGAMKAGAHIQLNGQKTAFPTFLLRPDNRSRWQTASLRAVITANALSREILSSTNYFSLSAVCVMQIWTLLWVGPGEKCTDVNAGKLCMQILNMSLFHFDMQKNTHSLVGCWKSKSGHRPLGFSNSKAFFYTSNTYNWF